MWTLPVDSACARSRDLGNRLVKNFAISLIEPELGMDSCQKWRTNGASLCNRLISSTINALALEPVEAHDFR
jgi:hypothetical protein